MPYQLTRKSWVFSLPRFHVLYSLDSLGPFLLKKNTGAVLLTDPRAGMARNFRHSFTFDHFSPRKTGNAERGTERHEGAKPGGEVGTDEAVQKVSCPSHHTFRCFLPVLFLSTTVYYCWFFDTVLSIKKAIMLNPHHVVRRKRKQIIELQELNSMNGKHKVSGKHTSNGFPLTQRHSK